MSRARGTTLVELMVALLILGLMAGIGVFAVQSLSRPASDDVAAIMNEAGRRAIRDGTPVRLLLDSLTPQAGPRLLLFLPDGRVLGRTADDST
ncbi:MAG TPA: prepilin-type N-terminal cleavage/methylation domain-containing protein [Gemmatimonadales bacterium]|nr:prepilin-type N-terminal cleavage/methylation domain-containing protein [Gemmatimonadales bacterium]